MGFDCFLTHDWGEDELGRDNHARVSEVYKRLKQAGFAPWFDEEFMRGDINQTMSDAMSRSSSVVAFITKRYIEKASGKGPNGANDNWCMPRQAPEHALELARSPGFHSRSPSSRTLASQQV